MTRILPLLDLRREEESDRESFRSHVARGLSGPRKEISPKYLYDERGSELFLQICELDEYYPTRMEKALLPRVVVELATMLPARPTLVELGPGGPEKALYFLRELGPAQAYVPVEISEAALSDTCDQVARLAQGLSIEPVLGDFTACLGSLRNHEALARGRETGLALLFLGSTIGNLDPPHAKALLQDAAPLLGRKGVLLLGIDLTQDSKTLQAAYDDSQGVTAEFNLNLLERMNRELGANFRREHFRHRAFFNREESRVEMHLVSTRAQLVSIAACGLQVRFEEGESIHTESSYKYAPEMLERLVRGAGLRIARTWLDPGPEGAPQGARRYGVSALMGADAVDEGAERVA